MSRFTHDVISMDATAVATVLHRHVSLILALLVLPVAFTSCVRIPIAEHQDLSRPNMVFESQGAFASRPSLFSQTEPGSAVSSGGQSAGCTACR
jgi:hypothetical protein